MGRPTLTADILRNADAGKTTREADAETAPLDEPEIYQYDIDTTEFSGGWRRGERDRLMAARPDPAEALMRSRRSRSSRPGLDSAKAGGRQPPTNRGGAACRLRDPHRADVLAVQLSAGSTTSPTARCRHAQGVRRSRREAKLSASHAFCQRTVARAAGSIELVPGARRPRSSCKRLRGSPAPARGALAGIQPVLSAPATSTGSSKFSITYNGAPRSVVYRGRTARLRIERCLAIAPIHGWASI